MLNEIKKVFILFIDGIYFFLKAVGKSLLIIVTVFGLVVGFLLFLFSITPAEEDKLSQKILLESIKNKESNQELVIYLSYEDSCYCGINVMLLKKDETLESSVGERDFFRSTNTFSSSCSDNFNDLIENYNRYIKVIWVNPKNAKIEYKSSLRVSRMWKEILKVQAKYQAKERIIL